MILKIVYIHACIILLLLFNVDAITFQGCTPFNTSKGATLPHLPTQFIADLEVEIFEHSRTFRMIEAYDYHANKMMIEFDNKRQITDFSLKEYREVNLTTKTCEKVFELPFKGRNVAPWMRGEHIAGTTKLFHFGREFGEKMVDKVTVRGYSCNHWRSCSKSNHSNYFVDYYFTDNETPVPVRCEVQGYYTRPNHNKTNPQMQNVSMHHIYDFISFKEGRPHQDMFEVPAGTLCKGVPNLPQVPNIADKMMYAVEYHNPRDQTNNKREEVQHAKVYYDYMNQVFRSDHYVVDNNKYVPITEIHTQDYGLQYTIRSATHCEITPIPQGVYDGKFIDNHINLERAFVDLKRNRYKYTYEGTTTVRGIKADIWIMNTTNTDKNTESETLPVERSFTKYENHFDRLEWYFSSNESSILSSSSKSQVPLRVVGYYGNTAKTLFSAELFHYDDGTHMKESIIHPISRCLQLGSSLHELTFFLDDPTQVNSVGEKLGHIPRMLNFNDQTDIIRNLEEKFASIGKVPTHRLAIELVTTSGRFDVRVRILGWPDTTVSPPKNFVDADTVARRLQDAIKREKIMLTYIDQNGKYDVTHTALFEQKYFDSMTMEFYPPAKKQKKCGHDTGTVVIVAIVLLLVGCLNTYVFIYLLLRRRGYSLTALLMNYTEFDKNKNQTDTIPAPTELQENIPETVQS